MEPAKQRGDKAAERPATRDDLALMLATYAGLWAAVLGVLSLDLTDQPWWMQALVFSPVFVGQVVLPLLPSSRRVMRAMRKTL